MEDLIVIYESQFLHEIYLIKHQLEREGIRAYTRNENVTSTIGVSMLQQYKLMVAEKEVENASRIIASMN